MVQSGLPDVRDKPLRKLIVAVNRQCGVNGRVNTTSMPSRSSCNVGDEPLRQLIVAVKRNSPHTQTHNKNNTTHDPTRTTPQHHNTRHDKNRSCEHMGAAV